jgi:A/G-specific adenine glycosylase
MKTLNINTRSDDAYFIKLVLTHYKNHGRHNLPWRKKINAYRVLVSEIMLQQTQVVRVTSKFAAWMKLYPTLTALSKASFKDVLVLWQGLGYQRRAKALYDISSRVKAIPKTYEELVGLPGVGGYTASAVCAFAYDTFSHPVLETNVRTALIEAFHKNESSLHDKILYQDLSRLEKNSSVVRVGARTWYYALMDYGAYLKAQKISHNSKSTHNTKQSKFEGSLRQLRAKVLFAITHNEALPADERQAEVVSQLLNEGFIVKKKTGYRIAD